MAAERHAFQEKFTDFKINEFQPGNQIAVYVNGSWQRAELAAPIEAPSGHRMKLKIIDPAGGGRIEVETGVPPKKIELPTSVAGVPSTVEIGGLTYSYVVDPAHIELDQDGDVVFNLRDTTGGLAGKERLGVKAEILRNLSEAKAVKQDVDNLIVRIDAVASIRRKELLSKQTELAGKVEKLLLEFGTPADWEDWESEEVEEVGQNLEKIRQQVKADIGELEKKMKEIEQWQVTADESNKQVEHVDACAKNLEIKDKEKIKTKEEQEKTRYDKETRDWKKEKRLWDEYKKGGKDKAARDTKWEREKGNTDFPEEPEGEEPKLGEVDKEAAKLEAGWEYFNTLEVTDPLYIEVEKRRKKQAHAEKSTQADYAYTAGPRLTRQQKEANKIFQIHTAEIMRSVIEEWKGKEEKKFKFDEEKKLLEDKVVEMRAEIAKYPPTKDLEALVKAIEVVLLPTTKDTAGIRDIFLAQWKEIGKIELEVYQREISAQSRPEIAERNIDIPQSLLAQIFANRKAGVQDLYKSLYTQHLFKSETEMESAIKKSLRGLFSAEPDRAVLLELKKHGIKSWDNFKTLIDGDLGNELIKVLGVMSKEHLNREVAKSTSMLDRTKAIKWLVLGKAVTGAVCVGVAAFAATALFPAAGLAAGIGLAAAGGATGGFVRGLVNRLGFGNKKAKEFTDTKMRELGEQKKAEFLEKLNNDGFRTENGIDRFLNQTNAEFSAIMAQCLREATTGKVGEKASEPDDFEKLDPNAKRIYVEALKNAEMSGMEVDAEKRKAFALALIEMQAKGMDAIKEAEKKADKGAIKKFLSELAGPNSDPVLIKLLAGSMKMYSGNVESTGAALACSSIMGAGMGVAFASASTEARAIMGGVGGALAGYQYGEGRRVKKEMAKGRESLLLEFNRAQGHFNNLGAISAEERGELVNLVIKLKGALKGGHQFETGQKEVEKDGVKTMVPIIKEEVEQWQIAALQDDPVLRKQVENLIYEAEKAGLLVERENREDFDNVLSKLALHRNEVVKQCEKSKWGERSKKWLGRNWERTLWTAGGAAAGAFSAVVVGQGVQEIKHHWFGIGMEQAHPGSTSSGEEASNLSVNEKGLLGKVVATGAVAETTNAGSGAPTSGGHGHDTVAPTGKGVGAEVGAVPKSEILEATIPAPEAGHQQLHLSDEMIGKYGFSEQQALETNQYLDKLFDKFPELNNPASVNRMMESGWFGKGAKIDPQFADYFKGSSMNNPLLAARFVDMVKFEEILKGGGSSRAAEYLTMRGLNEHSCSNMGIKWSDDPQVMRSRLESFSSDYKQQVFDVDHVGKKGAGLIDKLSDGLKHDENRDMYKFKTSDGHGLFDEDNKAWLRGKGGKGWTLGMGGDVGDEAMSKKLFYGNATEKVYHPTHADTEVHKHAASSADETPKIEKTKVVGQETIEPTKAPGELEQRSVYKFNEAYTPEEQAKITQAIDYDRAAINEAQEELQALKERRGGQPSWDEFEKAAMENIASAQARLDNGIAELSEPPATDHRYDLEHVNHRLSAHTKENWADTMSGAMIAGAEQHVQNIGGSGGGAPQMETSGGAPKAGAPVVEQTKATQSVLNPEQQKVADYLEKTGSKAVGRTEVIDETGKHVQEEKVGAGVNEQTNLNIEEQRNHQIFEFKRLENTWSDYFSDIDFGGSKSEALRDHIMLVLEIGEKETQSGLFSPMSHSGGEELGGGPELKWVWDQLTSEERFLLQGSSFGESFSQNNGTVIVPEGGGHAFKFIDSQGTTHFEFNPKYEYVNQGGQLVGKNMNTNELVPIDPAHPDAPVVEAQEAGDLILKPEDKELVTWLNKVTLAEGPDISDAQQTKALQLQRQFDQAVEAGNEAKAEKALAGIAKLKAQVEK